MTPDGCNLKLATVMSGLTAPADRWPLVNTPPGCLLKALAEVCVQRGYRRFEWSVLDWNEPSIRFYRSLGAVGMDEWRIQRLGGDALTRLATS
jgi:hypothetical protein